MNVSITSPHGSPFLQLMSETGRNLWSDAVAKVAREQDINAAVFGMQCQNVCDAIMDLVWHVPLRTYPERPTVRNLILIEQVIRQARRTHQEAGESCVGILSHYCHRMITMIIENPDAYAWTLGLPVRMPVSIKKEMIEKKN